jgi:predicted Fe-Mo cluster-binding NifX family protein
MEAYLSWIEQIAFPAGRLFHSSRRDFGTRAARRAKLESVPMNPTRLAIATADGVSVADHLAHASAFIVLEIEGGAALSRTVRNRASENCGNHATFVEMLAGCSAVVCGGIGPGAWDSLTAHGVQPLVLAAATSVEDALAGYLAGTLATTKDRVCLCH